MKKRVPTTLICLLAASVLVGGTAQADNRFASETGGIVDGTGSFGTGSVTVHHNLIPNERKEIDDEIAALRAQIADLNNQIAQVRATADQANTAANQASIIANDANSLAEWTKQELEKGYAFERYSKKSCDRGDLVLSSGLGGSAENSSDSSCARIVRQQ